MADLKPGEVEKAKFVYDVFGGGGELDGTQLGDAIRALYLNPSLDTLEKLGAQTKEGAKSFKFEEFCTIFSECKKAKKDQGCFEDFVECLKLYDKNENGRMLLAELTHALSALGEKLTETQVDEVYDDCMPEEDDEGQIEYEPFLKKMCDRE